MEAQESCLLLYEVGQKKEKRLGSSFLFLLLRQVSGCHCYNDINDKYSYLGSFLMYVPFQGNPTPFGFFNLFSAIGYGMSRDENRLKKGKTQEGPLAMARGSGKRPLLEEFACTQRATGLRNGPGLAL